jgi:dihydropteroate synthase
MNRTKLVGVLNVTPDSFSDGGQFTHVDQALVQAQKLIDEGADLLDVGGEATNPKATPITADDEWGRIKEVVTELIKQFPGKISLDTRHPQTARKFLEDGGTILNDVSGFRDPEMIKLAVKYQPLCIVNHFPGADSVDVHQQNIDRLDRVRTDLFEKREEMIAAGVNETNIVLDPGIGFGKTIELNNELVEFAAAVPGVQTMIGYSRKRFLGENRMEIGPNLAAGQRAIDSGAAFIRVHDIKPYKDLEQPVYLGLGTNIEPRQKYVDTTLEMLASQFGELQVSSIHETKAWGVTDQPDFLNLCVGFSTGLSPQALIERTQAIEKAVGRIHRKHWGPREIDIDILLYGDKVVDEKNLQIPHPGVYERASVLGPLVEIAPKATHPTLNKTVKELKSELEN